MARDDRFTVFPLHNEFPGHAFVWDAHGEVGNVFFMGSRDRDIGKKSTCEIIISLKNFED